MSQDISGTGTVVVLNCSTTFPGLPLTISQFADDADPLDIPALQIADSAMGLNGDLLKWRKANVISMTLNVVPSSPDDVNLEILANANRVEQGKVSANDIITATITYPDGRIKTFTGGIIVQYMPGNSISSSMRLKTKPYVFQFQGTA